MKTIQYLILLFCFAGAINAKSKEFTILGDQKIKAEVKRGIPLPAEKRGVRIEAAAFRTGDDGLEFGFMLTTHRAPTRIVVEEVSGSSPVLMVEDSAPTLKGGSWLGMARSQPITPAALPWLYENGDTTKVFRFSVTVADAKEPIVLFQPAVYSAEAKRMVTGGRDEKNADQAPGAAAAHR